MGLLHPDLWRELAPEFEARALVEQAIEILAQASDTAPVALSKKKLEETLRCFHPATQDAAAMEEYQARRDGTYEEPQPQGYRARQQSADNRRQQSADSTRELAAPNPNTQPNPIGGDQQASAENKQTSADDQQIAALMRSQMQMLEQMSQRLTKLEQPAQQQPAQPAQPPQGQ